MTIDLQPGLDRIRKISGRLDQDLLATVSGLAPAKGVCDQPWLIAGCSDGIGLQVAIAAIDAGLLKIGVGVYWEPPHLLDLNEQGNPVSPIHFARLQNALGIQEYARLKGAEFRVVEANVILTPPRTLKGKVKKGDSIAALPESLVGAFKEIRTKAKTADCVFINSVAFGKWISPRKGVDAVSVPSVDFDGRLIQMTTKKYHVRGYEETLDTMGRNHKALIDSLVGAGWLGPRSLSAFFTWAGGSQNVHSLQGVYGFGSLGDAKLLAEEDTTRFRLDHPVEFGAHAIVRFPAFLSAALMGIPGGGLFGLASRRVLEENRVFDDMPTLASKMVRAMFGPEWIRENPVSQIELDHAECLFVDEINAAMDLIHARIAKHREVNGMGANDAIDVEDSRVLLDGLVPANFVQLLGRFRPGESTPMRLSLTQSDLSELGKTLTKATPLDGSRLLSEEVTVESGPADRPVSAEVAWSQDGSEGDVTLSTPEGTEIGHAHFRFANDGGFSLIPTDVGTASQMVTVDDSWSERALALLPVARRGVRVEYGSVPSEGEELLAYVTEQSVTLVNSAAEGVWRATALA